MKKRLSITFLLRPTGRVLTGSAACILEYARRFQDRGHDVSLTTWPKFLWQEDEPFPGAGSRFPIYYDQRATAETLPSHSLNKTPHDHLGELQDCLANINLLTPAIPEADLIVAANWEGVIPAWQSGRGKPVHFPQHYDEVFFTLDENPSAGWAANPLIKMLCRNALQMPVYRIANSSWLAGEFRRRFGESIPFVQNGVDTSRFRPAPKLSPQDGVIRVVTCCRPEKWQGFQDAAPAMHQLLRRYPAKIEWNVYGGSHPELGPENPLAPYRFHGALGHEELSRLYAQSDIVLCPSWYESSPLPPMEAMACGTAVITTPYGAEDFAIDGHNALVVRPRGISEFVAALDALVRLPELRGQLARNGRAMAESHTWERAVKAREDLLWRIHCNQMPNHALHGFESGITDSNGVLFERLTAEVGAKDGELLHGADGRHYLVESGLLRCLSDPSNLGIDASQARSLDLLSLLRNVQGPPITSRANYYGLQALAEPVAR